MFCGAERRTPVTAHKIPVIALLQRCVDNAVPATCKRTIGAAMCIRKITVPRSVVTSFNGINTSIAAERRQCRNVPRHQTTSENAACGGGAIGIQMTRVGNGMELTGAVVADDGRRRLDATANTLTEGRQTSSPLDARLTVGATVSCRIIDCR